MERGGDRMRLALALLGLCLAGGCGWLPIVGTPSPLSTREEAIIDLAPADEWHSPLGLFPPTEMIDPAQFSSLGVKIVDPTLLGDGTTIETRRTPDGAYMTQIGEALFLTQRPRSSASPSWTLRVPPGTKGSLRVVAISIAGHIGLGVERPGDFTRLAWSDGRWSYVFFDIGHEWGIERLVALAESLR